MSRIKTLVYAFAFILCHAFGEKLAYNITDIDRYGNLTLEFSQQVNMSWLSTENNFQEMFQVYWKDPSKPEERQYFKSVQVTEFKSDNKTIVIFVEFEMPYYIGLYTSKKETVHIDCRLSFDPQNLYLAS